MRKAKAAGVFLFLVSCGFSSVTHADEPAAAPAPAPAPAPDSAAAAAPDSASASASAPDSAPAPAPPPNLGEPPPTRGAPRLHIEADRPGVRLLRIEQSISNDMGEGLLVRTACEAPCDKIIDGRKKQTFFVASEGMVPSRGFQLTTLDGDVSVRVRGGSFVGRQLGYLFAGFGGVGLLGGGVLLGFGYGSGGGSISGDGKVQASDNTGLQTAGWATLGVGAALTATAIVLILTSKTDISLFQENGKTTGISFSGGKLVF